jgi:CMP/dCMP kinase
MSARKLGFRYLDTGAMYRVATLISIRSNIGVDNENKLVEQVRKHKIEFEDTGNGTKVILDGIDVSDDLRTPELTKKIGPICELVGIRRLLGELQREMGKNGGVVLEGRDIGTVIFPDAEVKIFLLASPEERAKRRWLELKNRGIEVDLDDILDDISARDKRDSERDIAPLIKAEDAIEIDTTSLTITEVVEAVIAEVRKKY